MPGCEVLTNWGDWMAEKKAPPIYIERGRAALGEIYFGMRTVSMTWITPLEHMMSALVTVASLILTVPPSVLMLSDSPFTVFAELQLHRLSGGNFAGDDVIGEDGDELLFIFGLEEFVHSAGGKFGEGVVGGSEDGEGAFAFQSVHESRGL